MTRTCKFVNNIFGILTNNYKGFGRQGKLSLDCNLFYDVNFQKFDAEFIDCVSLNTPILKIIVTK